MSILTTSRQFRSRRVPDSTELSGYQADMGQVFWGCLYDESRRNRILGCPDPEALKEALEQAGINIGIEDKSTIPGAEEFKATLKEDGWNDYVIRCVGNHIELWVNGFKTVDYFETDDSIETTGIIGLQVHGGPPSECWYKDIMIKVVK